nr:carbonic anhydrase [uncultured Holophaga sp.]
MLPLLLALSLGLVSPEPPAHHESAGEAEMKKLEAKFPKKGVAVPEEAAKEATPSEVTHAAAPRRAFRPRKAKPAVHAPATLSESERDRQRLMIDNGRLQEEVARAKSRLLLETPIETPEAALGELLAGNQRFVEGRRVRSLLTTQDPALRESLVKGQKPFAVVVTCSDSRLMDNLIFDQELGRLFTIREAGNCPDIQGLASIEYAVEHLGSKVVVVMGHTACGAVTAVSDAHGKPLPGNLWSLQAAMAGLEEQVPPDPNETRPEHLLRLVRANAIQQAQVVLDRSEIVRHLVDQGKLKVVPALYDLSSGQVRLLQMEVPVAAVHH